MKIDNTITAEEAREISGPTIEERISKVYELIKEKAGGEKDNREVWLTSKFWTESGYSRNEDYKALKEHLESNGFKVDFFYEERQFVNMYVTIKW